MTITQLKYVITIAESSSITEAAQKLYMTQPSLSAAVRELEREYGIEIFNRTSRGISLTNDGSEFLAYARQIVDQSRLLEQRYSKKSLPASFALSPPSTMPLRWVRLWTL